MAKPQFVVQHFIASLDARWEGVAGPRTLRTLEGVGYTYRVPPDAESPELDLWVYLRLFLTNGVTGSRRFWVEVLRLDGPGEPSAVSTLPLGDIPFRGSSPVVEGAHHLGVIQFPYRGRYEFRLKCEVRKRWSREAVGRVVGREYIQIE